MRTSLGVLVLSAVALQSAAAQIIMAPPVRVGDSVRVRLLDRRAVQPEIVLMSSAPKERTGRVVYADGDSLVMSIDGRIANVAGIGIGRQTSEVPVRYDQMERLDAYRGRGIRKPGPVRIGLSVALAAGTYALASQPGAKCGERLCTPSERRSWGVVGGVLVGGAAAFWPVSKWTTLRLPE